MKPTIFCPVCTSQNKHHKLVLYQINLTSAVYLCEDKKCVYPKGHEWIEVKRTLSEMATSDTNPKDLDNWLHSLLDSSEISASGMTDNSIDTDELLSQICSEFENMSDTGGNIHANDFEDYFFDLPILDEDNSPEITKVNLDSISNTNKDDTVPSQIYNNSIGNDVLANGNIDNVNPALELDCTENGTHSLVEKDNLGSKIERKTKVIVNKTPGLYIRREQILEILKQLPPSRGKTIVLNLRAGPKS